ncbi:MAG: gamma-glutamylcyclotransferase [Desulfobacterales bacterium]
MNWRSMGHLFAYGTLMCNDIMEEIVGSHLSPVSATLRGYRRMRVKGEHYPALVPDAEQHVEGVVYRNISGASWDRLDQFEGKMYSRKMVQVELNDGQAVPAETYVARAEFMDYLVDAEWDFAEFLRKNKGSFRRSYKGYRALKIE